MTTSDNIMLDNPAILVKKNLISFPRSGQAMTAHALSDFHNKFNIPFNFCEYYSCCKEVPCKYNNEYQKNHDFNLKLKIKDEEKYIFLYRKDKIEQLEAYYRFVKKNVDYNQSNQYTDLIQFCKNNSVYYDKMLEKYALQPRHNILCIDYNEYINDPSHTFYKIIIFFGYNISKNQISKFMNEREEKIFKRTNLNINFKKKVLFDLNKKNGNYWKML